MTDDLWEVRSVSGDLSLELRAGDRPALVLVRGGDRVRVELREVKVVDGAAELAGWLAGQGPVQVVVSVGASLREGQTRGSAPTG